MMYTSNRILKGALGGNTLVVVVMESHVRRYKGSTEEWIQGQYKCEAMLTYCYGVSASSSLLDRGHDHEVAAPAD